MVPPSPFPQRGPPERIHIGVVGGGRRCLSLLQMLESYTSSSLRAEIVGVADIDPQAAGYRYADTRGFFTTSDYRRLFELPEVDLIINLTGSQKLSEDLTARASEKTAVLPYPASKLLQEIVQDVLSASRRMAEQDDQLSRSHYFAQAMAQATIASVMILDRKFRIQWINQAGSKMCGMSREEAEGRYCFQVSHHQLSPCSLPDSPCPMQETLTTGRMAHAIHEHRTLGNQTRYCDVTTFPLLNKDGQVGEVVEFIKDITADLNDKLETRTRDLKKDLARLVQEDKLIALGKMVASVAHEINNPIAAIINFATLVRESLSGGDIPEERLAAYRRYLDMTVREANRCGKIVGNLLSFARQQPVEPKAVNLVEIVDRIVALTHHKLELSNIELRRKMRRRPLEVWGDYTQIQQCLINLVFNAMEAMPNGGRLSIKAREEKSLRQVWVEVTDTGVGIEPRHMPFIFEPFFTTKTDGHGVGLGLSIVYGIVREHHGDISVNSRKNRGTTFQIRLPAHRGQPAEGGSP